MRALLLSLLLTACATQVSPNKNTDVAMEVPMSVWEYILLKTFNDESGSEE